MLRAMLLLTLLLPASALAGAPEKAEKLAAKADAAQEGGDLSRGWKLATKALKLDPNNVHAHYVAGLVLLMTAQSAEGDQQTQLVLGTLQHWSQVAELEPDSVRGGIARDFLKGFGEDAVATLKLPGREVPCSPNATRALETAEAALHRRDMPAAAAAYQDATNLCPANYEWWTWYGDYYFLQKDYPAAIGMYRKSRELEPCFPAAWRFEADALSYLGQGDQAWQTALRGVACDPTYNAGWQMLVQMAPHRGRTFERPRIQKPPVDPDGKTITAMEGPDAAIWLVYSMNQTIATGTPLERERDSVRKAIEGWKAMGSPAGGPWKWLADSDAAGRLDHAIFTAMLDERLVPEFLAWRVAHLDETAAFVDTFSAGAR